VCKPVSSDGTIDKSEGIILLATREVNHMTTDTWNSLSDTQREIVDAIVDLGDDARWNKIFVKFSLPMRKLDALIDEMIELGAIEVNVVNGLTYYSEV